VLNPDARQDAENVVLILVRLNARCGNASQ
jgi:hypothetical protein